MSPRKNLNDPRGFLFSQGKDNLFIPSQLRITKPRSCIRTKPSADVAMEASLSSKRKRQHEEAKESHLPNWKRIRTTKNPNIGTGCLSMDQIKEHLLGLQEFGNGQGVDLPNGTTKQCKLCGLSTLMLAPEPKLCSACGLVIKCNANYHRTAEPASSEQLSFCHKCFTQSHKSITFFNGKCFPKKTLVLTKNVEKIEEPFVQCDTCGEWNHQICGLHNRLKEKYKCPKCQLREMETKTARSSGVSFFCAKDLPQTELGNFIEQRLLRRLREDRKERAMASGKPLTEVPGAQDLFVRVVLSVKKKSTVGDNLLSVLLDYPKEFPYTFKMILLFQKIGGVDVCLFSMYVQEYGSECRKPNQRYCYISYIDSVKYFTPDIATSAGEALRTFAYHQVLIGYIDYAKKRGFTRCFLWSCPPLKGDEYIFNCRPVSQKAPKSDRLRLWYQKMLKKAAAQGIVVSYSNLYDRFFVQTGESGHKISTAHLPYFDGDYWPGVVEKLVTAIDKEETDKKSGKEMTRTSLKVLGLPNLDKDVLVMQKLEHYILPYKEDFMVIDLQYFCSRCHEPILSGKRWLFNELKNSYLCQRCHDQHRTSSKRDQNSKSELVVAVPIDIEDKDSTIENEKCESRQIFLKFCQENHYQFDTLRRAKHSSLMILHHIRPRARSKGALSEEERLELMEIVEHVSRCTTCYGNSKCNVIKAMFVHCSNCEVQADGGCLTCLKVWNILYSHSSLCIQLNCTMPHCRELKIKLRMQDKI